MNIKEKLSKEEHNLSSIIIYVSKGVFAYAYEYSAYAFTKMVKNYQIKIYHNTELDMDYVSIGIPQKIVETLLRSKFDNISVSTFEDGYTVYTIHLEIPVVSENEFLIWKDGLKKKNRETDIVQSNNTAEDDKYTSIKWLVDDIMAQQLSEYTPMKALNYLSELQKRILHDRIQ